MSGQILTRVIQEQHSGNVPAPDNILVEVVKTDVKLLSEISFDYLCFIIFILRQSAFNSWYAVHHGSTAV